MFSYRILNTSFLHLRVISAIARNPPPAAKIQNRRAAPEFQPKSTAHPAAEIDAPAMIRPQNGDSSHSGRTDPSGFEKPPGRSSSIVISVPTSGQPTKKIANAMPRGTSSTRCTAIDPPKAKAISQTSVFRTPLGTADTIAFTALETDRSTFLGYSFMV